MADIKKFKRGDKTQLTPNFQAKEFDCQCGKCPETLIDLDHVKKLQKLRDDMGAAIRLNSAYRCPAHNAAVGGEKNSIHMKGQATDIVIVSMSPDEVADGCEHFDGLGRYDTFTHVDSRGSKARWDFRSKKKAKKTDVKINLKDLDS